MKDDILEEIKDFDFENSNVHLWTFKTGQDAKDKTLPRFTGRWIRVGPDLIGESKIIASNEVNRVTEVRDYSLLAENNQSSALHLPLEITHADLIIEACSDETEKARIKKIKDLKNSVAYVVKFVNHGEIFYGVKRTPDNWSIKKRRDLVSINYSDQTVEVDNDDSFGISKYFDVIFWKDSVLALRDKTKFESILKYKEAHVKCFDELCEEQEFKDVFCDLGPISRYVSNNKIQLRRAAAIQQKGYYRDSDFMDSLRANIGKLQLHIDFEDDGKISPKDETCPDIFKALLDHRLLSHYLDRPFDVQDSVSVESN